MSEANLRAEFVLAADDRPTFTSTTRNHYKIRLYLSGVPTWVTLVSYQLHPTYWNPIRQVSCGTPEFQEFITAYGDFDVTVTLRGDRLLNLPAAPLSAALEERYRGQETAEIRAAIEEIKRN